MTFFRVSASQSRPIDVTVYSRPGCHLCEVAQEVILATARQGAIQIDLRVVDIESNAELRDAYDQQIPVVVIEGKKAFKVVVDRKRLAERFRREAGRLGEASR